MSVRSDLTRCRKWLEETFSTFGAHVTEKVLLVLPGFFDKDDKIAVDDVRTLLRFLGLSPTAEQLRKLEEELDPDRTGHFLLDQSRPIFQFLKDNLSSVEEVADSFSKSVALRDGYSATKEILSSIRGAERRESFLNMVESMASDIGQMTDSEWDNMFKNNDN